MKNFIKSVLQRLLGYRRYLRLFAWTKVKTLQWDGRERDFFEFLRRLPDDGFVIDVGANLGFLCTHIARRVSRGRVLAFEPLPDNFAVLQVLIRRFRLNNVDACRIAIGDRHGEADMILPVIGHARQQGLGHIADPGDGATHEEGVPYRVPIRRLDDLVDANDPRQRVTAIKIDVENFERFVLRGARRILERDRPLVYLELWDNDNRRECFELARELGYRVMVLEDGQLAEFVPERHRTCGNFFFVAGSRAMEMHAPSRAAAVASSGS